VAARGDDAGKFGGAACQSPETRTPPPRTRRRGVQQVADFCPGRSGRLGTGNQEIAAGDSCKRLKTLSGRRSLGYGAHGCSRKPRSSSLIIQPAPLRMSTSAC
jgi:hypothetical protein